MNKRFSLLSLIFAVMLGICCRTEPAFANESQFAEVKIGKTDVFTITNSESQTAEERAVNTNRRIRELLTEPDRDPAKIFVRANTHGNQEIALDDFVIISLGPEDALKFGKSQEELAMDWASTLRTRMTQLKPLYMQLKHLKQEKMSKPLSNNRVMLFMIQIATLLIAAVIGGEIMARLGQPVVIGQLLSGVVLGPSLLGGVFPELYNAVFPLETTQQYLIDIISWMGVIFLLMLTGTETDIELIKKKSKAALSTSIGAILLPLTAGIATAFLLPQNFLVLPDQRPLLGLFLGTVFSVSSVTVIAKILIEMKLLRRDIGQTILASALMQDLCGCVLLAFVAALAGGSHNGTWELIKMPVGIIAFVVFGATIGRKLLMSLFRWVQDRSYVDYAGISLIVIFLMVSSAITQLIGVNVVLGAFAVGVLLAQSPLVGKKVLHPLEAVTMSIFAPVFFAAAGLHVNLTLLKDPKLLAVSLAVTIVACFSKIIGVYICGAAARMGKWESLSIAFGTNARGTMGLIVGILGFSLGILTVNLFTVIVLMSLISTAIAPFLLKWSLPKVSSTAEELERLEREEKQAHSFLGKIRRILLPVKPGSRHQLSSKLIEALRQQHPIEATALTIQKDHADKEDSLSDALASSSKDGNATIVTRTLESDDPAGEILKEAQLNYDLIVLESTRAPKSSSIFGPIIDEVARTAPCPILIARESSRKADWNIKKILIPTTGRWQTAHAAELGVVLAKTFSASITSLCVLEQSSISYKTLLEDLEQKQALAGDIAQHIAALAESSAVPSESVVRVATDPAEEIIQLVKEKDIDLVILAAIVRTSDRLFLGNTVRALVEKLDCHLAVLSPRGLRE